MARKRMTVQEVVQDFEDRQRSVLPVDLRRTGRILSPWSGMGNASRTGLVAFGVLFFGLAAGLFLIVGSRGLDEEGWTAALLGVALTVVSVSSFRRAFWRK